MRYSFVSVLLLAAPAFAQLGNFDRPLAGYVYSAHARTVRPLLGFPGSATIGSPAWSDVDFASVAPGGKGAVISQAGQTRIGDTILDISSVDRAVWSRNGSVAVVYSSSANRLERVRIAGSGIAAETPIDLAQYGPLTALAVDAAAQRIAIGVAGAGLYMIDGDQPPALLAAMAQPVAAAFDDAGNIYAIDMDSRSIVRLSADAGPSEFVALGDAEVSPAGLAISGGGRYLVLADQSAHAARIYEISSQTLVNTIALDFAPSRMERLSSGAIFLLNGDNANEWLMVLDARETPSIFFVPAPQEAAQ